LDNELFDIVLSHNMHGPCGEHNTNAACMNDTGDCQKKYPRGFVESTSFGSGNYPIYRRRDSGLVKKGKYVLDNRRVVPYNPYLSRKYNCHINVECCSFVSSIKYINKYINKSGYDSCTVKATTGGGSSVLDYDETDTFHCRRYIGACEAMWRPLSFKMFDMSLSVLIMCKSLSIL